LPFYIIAYTTLYELLAVFLYIIFAVLLKFEKSLNSYLHTTHNTTTTTTTTITTASRAAQQNDFLLYTETTLASLH